MPPRIILDIFQQRYAHNPLSLYQTVQQCLNSEMHLVQRAEGVSDIVSVRVSQLTVQHSTFSSEWMPPVRWQTILFIRSSNN